MCLETWIKIGLKFIKILVSGLLPGPEGSPWVSPCHQVQLCTVPKHLRNTVLWKNLEKDAKVKLFLGLLILLLISLWFQGKQSNRCIWMFLKSVFHEMKSDFWKSSKLRQYFLYLVLIADGLKNALAAFMWRKIIAKFLLASMKTITDLKILYKTIFKELVRKQE